MKTWQLSIKIENEPQDEITLFDIQKILDGYLNVNRTFFDELLDIVKMINKYSVGKGIEKVTGPDSHDWTFNPWLLIMVKDKENDIPFWFLFKREKDLTGYLVAVGPEKYFNYCQSSKEPDDDIKKFIEYIIAYPEKFLLSVIIPNYID